MGVAGKAWPVEWLNGGVVLIWFGHLVRMNERLY